MKKKNKPKIMTEMELLCQEEILTNKSRETAETKWFNEWKTHLFDTVGTSLINIAKLEDFARSGIFDQCCRYLDELGAGLTNGCLGEPTGLDLKYLKMVIRYDFKATHEEYEWDGCEFDFSKFPYVIDNVAFPTKLSVRRQDVIRALNGYIIRGGSAARKASSDSYAIWRQALLDFQFKYRNFAEPPSEKDFGEFLELIAKAARTLWADHQFTSESIRTVKKRKQ